MAAMAGPGIAASATSARPGRQAPRVYRAVAPRGVLARLLPVARPPAVRIRAVDHSGKPIPAGQVAFDVFCAVGYVAGKPLLWRAEAFPTARPANWSTFLGSLPGEPRRIVCDAHGGMLPAIAGQWPEARASAVRMAPPARSRAAAGQ